MSKLDYSYDESDESREEIFYHETESRSSSMTDESSSNSVMHHVCPFLSIYNCF